MRSTMVTLRLIVCSSFNAPLYTHKHRSFLAGREGLLKECPAALWEPYACYILKVSQKSSDYWTALPSINSVAFMNNVTVNVTFKIFLFFFGWNYKNETCLNSLYLSSFCLLSPGRLQRHWGHWTDRALRADRRQADDPRGWITGGHPEPGSGPHPYPF